LFLTEIYGLYNSYKINAVVYANIQVIAKVVACSLIANNFPVEVAGIVAGCVSDEDTKNIKAGLVEAMD
jgi:hypothetical protein